MAGEINFYSPCEPKFRDHGPPRTPYIPFYALKNGLYSTFMRVKP